MLIGFDASRAFVREATGTENYSLNLLKALARVDRRNKYRVYLRSQSGKSFFARKTGFKWKVNGNRLYTPDFDFELPKNFVFWPIRPSRLWTQLGLAFETWRSPPDVLFVPAHTLPILRRRRIGISNWLRFLTKSKFQISNFPRCVVTIHDLGVEYLPNYHKFPQRYYLDFASRYAAAHADAIIAVSAATKADLVNKYEVDGKKISVVHEGVDRGFFKPQSKSKVESVKSKYKIKGPYILFVGTIQPRKNLLMLIQAFAKLVESQSRKSKVQKNSLYTPDFDFELVIAGKPGWDYKDILDAPKKFGVEKRVKFIGRVEDADLPALYTGATVFVYPSLFEGFGLPILEALSCGCPVIASDIPPHREISQLVPMILVKPKEEDAWVESLYQTITQYDIRLTLNNKNHNFEAKLNWDEAAKKTIAVFEAVFV